MFDAVCRVDVRCVYNLAARSSLVARCGHKSKFIVCQGLWWAWSLLSDCYKVTAQNRRVSNVDMVGRHRIYTYRCILNCSFEVNLLQIFVCQCLCSWMWQACDCRPQHIRLAGRRQIICMCSCVVYRLCRQRSRRYSDLLTTWIQNDIVLA